MDPRNQSRFQNTPLSGPPDVGVHVLSEHVFCPRSAALTRETDDDQGEDEPPLGPKLPSFTDFSEHRFVEELQRLWTKFRLWMTLIAPAIALPLLMWRFVSPLAGLATSLPLFYFVAQLWDTVHMIFRVSREHGIMQAAEVTPVNLDSDLIREIHWWSLRKLGFDCEKPVDTYRNAKEGLRGRPWRVLSKGDLRIPVIRQHRGDRTWRPKHVLRIAAYCRLIESCENAKAPFGVLLFGGSYECVIIPNSAATQSQLDRALHDVREFLRIQLSGKFVSAAPTDNRCRGCHWGEPRKYVRHESETVVNGNTLVPLQTRGKDKQTYHSTCGDRFQWVPPHDLATGLGIAERQ